MIQMNRARRFVLWACELISVFAMVLMLTLPILDYDKKERMAWFLHPSPQAEQSLQSKHREELLMRAVSALPFALAGAFCGFRLRKRKVATDS